MLGIAFKEWAVVCQALAEGRQALILRKGGIDEAGGEFRPEYSSFWLYPTAFHEHRETIKPEEQALFGGIERPPAGTLRLSHFAEVAAVYRVDDWSKVAALDDLHIWTSVAVRAKFDYRTPGLFVLPVRIYRAPQPSELPESAVYAGCKTWVELESGLPTDGAVAVVDDRCSAMLLGEVQARLRT